MGKSPEVIIIARHGARLDAADKQWHLSSPTPYDPPLTYGGWAQGRALGARIASLLQAREEAPEDTVPASDSGGDATPSPTATPGVESSKKPKHTRVRKHKVIIHTSPFLRCLQTAVAISAGYRQFQKVPVNKGDTVTSSPSIFLAGEPGVENLRPASSGANILSTVNESEQPETESHESTNTPAATTRPETVTASPKPHHLTSITPKSTIPKCRLRVDAFLGEWLSPDYFEKIAPPPSSTMMVVHAKAELLKRAEVIQDTGSKSLAGHFPGGWHNSPTSSPNAEDRRPFPATINQRQRSASQSVAPGAPVPVLKNIRNPPTEEDSNLRDGYIPPVPSYAVSPSDPIPAGYVAHARDACVAPDYQWDSMREPLNWGGGGEFGEEWSAMHVRFRKGFQHMINWYRIHDQPHFHGSNGHHSPYVYEKHDDEDYTDLVLVLVTHGAGCNALIGALTGQPALLDVSMASLTMAVRKTKSEQSSDSPERPESENSQRKSRRRSAQLSIASEYEIKLLASTEHLQAGAHPLSIPSLPTPPIQRSASMATTTYRHRLGSTTRTNEVSNYFHLADHSRRHSGDIDTRRPPRGAVRQMFRRGTGLWGSSVSSNDRFDDSGSGSGSGSEDDFIPNFKAPAVTSSPAQSKKTVTKKEQDNGGSDEEARDEVADMGTATSSAGINNNNDNNNINDPSNESIAAKGWTTHQLPERPKADTGLWSPASAPSSARQPTHPKRRWTVTDH